MKLKENEIINTQKNCYQVRNELGDGQFGIVYLAFNHTDQQEVAIKQVDKMHLKNPKIKELFGQEIRIQSDINSPNVVALKEAIDHPQTNSHLVILEYCQDGDMEKLIKKNGFIQERQAIAYFKQILNGFKDMHSKNYMHRDIKSANIFLHKGVAKLGDFGFAKQLNNGEDITKTSLGTIRTMAPEVFYQQEYGFEADMYSLGVVFYHMLFGDYPFDIISSNPYELFKKAEKENINFNKGGIKVSPQTQDLITKMLRFERKNRITWSEIYQHPVVRESRQFPEEEINLSILVADNVFNPQANQQFYANNPGGNILPLKLRNQINQVPANKNQINQLFVYMEYPNQEMINLNNQPPQNQIQISQKQFDESKLKQEDFQMSSLKYIHKRNIYGIMVQMLNQFRQLPQFVINYQIPAFLTCKKLIKMIKEYISILEQKQNVFQAIYFNEFAETQEYKCFIQSAKNDLNLVRGQYNDYLDQCAKSIKKLRIKYPQLLAQLKQEDCDKDFEESYKGSLLNYSCGLREQANNDQTIDQRKLFSHVILISNITRIDTFENKNYNFNFEKYKQEILNTPFNQFESKYEEACNQIFC